MTRRPSDPTEVFERYRRQLRAFISRRVGSVQESEDILQEVFMRFLLSDAVDPIAQVAAWLFRTARNRIVDHRRKIREASLPQADGDDDAAREITDLLADDRSSPESEYLRMLVWEELGKALDELPAAQREVFCLTEMEGVSFREIARRTGIPVATLLSRKHYAVKYLRRRLAEIYEALLID